MDALFLFDAAGIAGAAHKAVPQKRRKVIGAG